MMNKTTIFIFFLFTMSLCLFGCDSTNEGSTFIGNTEGSAEAQKITIGKLQADGSSTINVPLAIFGGDEDYVDGATIDIDLNEASFLDSLLASSYYQSSSQNVSFSISGLSDGDSIDFMINRVDGLLLIYSGVVSLISETYATYSSSSSSAYLQVSSGEFHTCAVKEDGSVQCWGKGYNGRLGNGSNDKQTTPVDVIDENGSVMMNFTQVSAGEDHTCALNESGQVLCWGMGDEGRLGNGETQDYRYPQYVVDASGTVLDGFTEVSAGTNHTCALTEDGEVMCWGKNSDGQLGNGSQTNKSYPVSVVTESGSVVTGFTSVQAGADYTCALKEDTTIMCWGTGRCLRLANEDMEDDFSTNPLYVEEEDGTRVTGFTSISTSIVNVLYGFSCALKSDSSISCWGGDYYGQLGNGVQGSGQTWPDLVIDEDGILMTGFSDVSAGNLHTCAIQTDGTAMCWGSTTSGQVGNGSTDTRYSHPMYVTDETETPYSEFSQISAGGNHTCAVTEDGRLLCWGQGSWGQLGNASTETQSYPVFVE